MAQYQNPVRGDWVSCCLNDLKYLNINISIEEIKIMKKTQFKKLLKESIKNKALEYLLDKQGSKGKEIKYSCLKMAEYLLPNEEKLSISERRNIFAIRNRMIDIENNFKNRKLPEKCCGQIEDQQHIYTCQKLNTKKAKIEYNKIFEENVKIQKEIMKRFSENYEKRKQIVIDPLEPSGRSTVITSLCYNSNG